MANIDRVINELKKFGVLAQHPPSGKGLRDPWVIEKDFPIHRVDIYKDIESLKNYPNFEGVDAIEDLVTRIYSDIDENKIEEIIKEISGRPGLWGDEREQGVDALAWYLSFHHYPARWGIYIPLSGLLKFSMHIAAPEWRSTWLEVVRTAFRALMAHELFHYAIDYGSAQLEILERVPIYVKGRSSLSGKFGYVELEEAIANGFSLRAIRNSGLPGLEACFKRFMNRQPAGYRDGINFKGRVETINGVKAMLRDAWMAAGGGHSFYPELTDYFMLLPFASCSEWPLRNPRGFAIDGCQCPVYIIDDLNKFGAPQGSVGYITCVPQIYETTGFKKDLAKLRAEHIWESQTKPDLAQNPIPAHCGFDAWPYGDTKSEQGFYANLGRGKTKYRVHLRRPRGPSGAPWTAYEAVDSERSGHHKGGRRGRR